MIYEPRNMDSAITLDIWVEVNPPPESFSDGEKSTIDGVCGAVITFKPCTRRLRKSASFLHR